MSKRVTVYDIARELNVSPATVSRVLNRSDLISGKRTEQIMETARRLGYQKRSVKKHGNRVILNVHLFLPPAGHIINHFFYNISELIESVQEGFGEVRINFITRVNDGNLDFLQRKKTGRTDGCVFAFTKPNAVLMKELNTRHIPFILLNRKGRSGSYVICDVDEGIRQMAAELYRRKGASLRPCFVGYAGLKDISDQRFCAVKTALKSKNIAFGHRQRQDVRLFSEIPGAVTDWIVRERFNAVFSFNDVLAAAVLQSVSERGLRVPEDLAVTGIDHSPLQEILSRKIDTVSLSIHQLGLTAGRWLRDYIINKNEVRIRKILKGLYVPGDTIFVRENGSSAAGNIY